MITIQTLEMFVPFVEKFKRINKISSSSSFYKLTQHGEELGLLENEMVVSRGNTLEVRHTFPEERVVDVLGRVEFGDKSFLCLCFREKCLFTGDQGFEVPLNKSVTRVFCLSGKRGLVMQMQSSHGPSLFHMGHPLVELGPVKFFPPISGTVELLHVDDDHPVAILSNNGKYAMFESVLYQSSAAKSGPKPSVRDLGFKHIMDLKTENNKKLVSSLCVRYVNPDDFVLFVLFQTGKLFCILGRSKRIREIDQVVSIKKITENIVLRKRCVLTLKITGVFTLYFREYAILQFKIGENFGRPVSLRECVRSKFHVVFENKSVRVADLREVLPHAFAVLDVFDVLKMCVPVHVFSNMYADYLHLLNENRGGVNDEFSILRAFISYLLGIREVKTTEVRFKTLALQLLAEENENHNKNTEIDIGLLCKTDRNEFSRWVSLFMFILHLRYEEYRVNVLQEETRQRIGELLSIIAVTLGWTKYVHLYSTDNPTLTRSRVVNGTTKFPNNETLSSDISRVGIVFHENYVNSCTPPMIFDALDDILVNNRVNFRYPIARTGGAIEFLARSRKVLRAFHVFASNSTDIFCPLDGNICMESGSSQRVLFVYVDENLHEFNETFPWSVSMFLSQVGVSLRAISSVIKGKPWMTTESFRLIGREDLARLYISHDTQKTNVSKVLGERKVWQYYDYSDTRENVENIFDADRYYADIHRWTRPDRLLGYRVFSNDRRLDEAWDMFSNTKPFNVPKGFQRRVSGFGNFEQKLLILLFSLSIGRGMLHLCTRTVSMTDVIKIPPLHLVAHIQLDEGVQTIDLVQHLPDNEGEVTAIRRWPEFHLACSTALELASARSDPRHQVVTREWILFHKKEKASTEHAGFLMGLGVLGHLGVLARTDLFTYLSAQHEQTSIAVLLGYAISQMRTQDSVATRTLSMHVQTLSPNKLLQISQVVQAASLVGLGFLYLESGHRFLSNVLLAELIRPPIDEWRNKECFCLSAGLGFGLINLSLGTKAGPPITLKDMDINELLFRFVEGGKYPMETREFIPKNYYKESLLLLQRKMEICQPVTAPGAVAAITLMYLMSGNEKIEARLRIPQRKFELKSLIPDQLLQRTIASNLVMWDTILPTNDWILSQSPHPFRSCKYLDSDNLKLKKKKTWETSFWLIVGHYYTISAACYSLGLKYAGSGRKDICRIMSVHFDKVLKASTEFPSEKLSLDYCCVVILISMSFIMAGRGDIDVVNRIKAVRDVQAGNFSIQFPLTMAQGLNYLGGGRLTLKTTPVAIACLFISFYPKFPSTIVDNKFHLQAFRHIFVLATEPRLLEAIDVDTDLPCFVPIKTVSKPYADEEEVFIEQTLPCLIPERQHIERIEVAGKQYYPITLTGNQVETVLRTLVLYVKKKSAYSHTEKKNKNDSVQSVLDSEKGKLRMFAHEKNSHIFALEKYVYEDEELELGKMKLVKMDQMLFRSLLLDAPIMMYVVLFVRSALRLEGSPDNVSNLNVFLKVLEKCEKGMFSAMFMMKIRHELEIELYKNDNKGLQHALGLYLKSGVISSNKFGAFLKLHGIPSGKMLKDTLVRIKKMIGTKKIAIPFLLREFPKLNLEVLEILKSLIE